MISVPCGMGDISSTERGGSGQNPRPGSLHPAAVPGCAHHRHRRQPSRNHHRHHRGRRQRHHLHPAHRPGAVQNDDVKVPRGRKRNRGLISLGHFRQKTADRQGIPAFLKGKQGFQFWKPYRKLDFLLAEDA